MSILPTSKASAELIKSLLITEDSHVYAAPPDYLTGFRGLLCRRKMMRE